MLTHFIGSCSAVQPYYVNVERLECTECSTDLRPHQHCSVSFDCYRSNDNNVPDRIIRFNGFTGTVNCCLSLQKVLGCFDEQGVDTAIDEPTTGLAVCLLEKVVGRVEKCWQFRARP